MVFEELNNLLLINNVDVYATYKVFLTEDKMGEHTNIESILTPSSMKTNTPVDIREQPGEKYSSDLKPVNEARDITLYFICHGDSKTDFLNNYQSFIAFIKSGKNGTGWLDLKIAELDIVFKIFVKQCSKYSQLTYLNDDLVAAMFKVTFREPQPVI